MASVKHTTLNRDALDRAFVVHARKLGLRSCSETQYLLGFSRLSIQAGESRYLYFHALRRADDEGMTLPR